MCISCRQEVWDQFMDCSCAGAITEQCPLCGAKYRVDFKTRSDVVCNLNAWCMCRKGSKVCARGGEPQGVHRVRPRSQGAHGAHSVVHRKGMGQARSQTTPREPHRRAQRTSWLERVGELEETVCEPEASEPAGSELQSVQLATALQQRLHDSIRGLIRDSNNRKIIAGQAFIARSCYSMFVTTQAVCGVTYGIEWPALVYICYRITVTSFLEEPDILENGLEPDTRGMLFLIRQMGMSPTPGGSDETLMRDARRWARCQEAELAQAMSLMWTSIQASARLKLTLQSLAWPTASVPMCCLRARLGRRGEPQCTEVVSLRVPVRSNPSRRPHRRLQMQRG